MELQHLKYFVDAIEHGSFAKAAEETYVTRQTISNAVSQLESELGYTLLVRNKNGVELTSDGAQFYDRIKDQFVCFDQLQREMLEYGSKYRLFVKIGISQYMEDKDVQHIRDWSEKNPEYHAEIVFCKEREGIRKLEKEELNFLFTSMWSESGTSYISEVIAEKRVVANVHRDNPLYQLDKITVSDLKDQVIISTDHGLDGRQYLDQGCMPDLSGIPRSINSDAIYNLSLLLANKGVLLGTDDSMIFRSLKGVRGIPFEEEYSYPYYLDTSADTLKNKAYHKVYRSLKKHLVTVYKRK